MCDNLAAETGKSCSPVTYFNYRWSQDICSELALRLTSCTSSRDGSTTYATRQDYTRDDNEKNGILVNDG